MTPLQSQLADFRLYFLSEKNPRIPRLSPDVTHLLKAVVNDDIPLNELEHLIEKYPLVAARLLALANSSWSAPMNEVFSVQHACLRLGREVVRTVAIATTISSKFDASVCPNFDTRRFWCTNLILADAAQALVPYFDTEPTFARTAGLFRHFGLLWLTTEAPQAVGVSLQVANSDPSASLDESLIERCGLGYLDATAFLLRAWQLPEKLAESVDPETRSGHSLGPLLQLASDVASVLYAGISDDPPCMIRSETVDPNTLAELCMTLAEKTQRTKEFAESMFP